MSGDPVLNEAVADGVVAMTGVDSISAIACSVVTVPAEEEEFD